MSLFHQNILAGASGAAGAAGAGLYVDDVFSCFVYEGTSATRSINNGIDLDGEGGLVWVKARDQVKSHIFTDTERGVNKYVRSDSNDAENTNNSFVTAFNSNGFSLGDGTSVNGNFANPKDYVSWTFRKAPGFFDVVTYTGDASGGSAVRSISHNLGSAPGMVVVKCTSDNSFWSVWHRSASLSYQQRLRLDDAGAIQSGEKFWGNSSTAPDMNSSTFSVGTSDQVNGSGRTYVAYIFAHDDQSFGTDSDEAIIKCGSFTLDGSGNATVDLGFEPQWLLIKKNAFAGWWLVDTMRGMSVASGDNVKALFSDSSSAESDGDLARPTATGFTVGPSGNLGSSADCFYVAIRRPHKPPEAGTDVFAMDTAGGTSPTPPQFTSGFPVDLAWRKTLDNSTGVLVGSRLQGTNYMRFSSTAADDPASALTWDHQNGWSRLTSTDADLQGYLFKRAAGFMDVVAYQGNGSARSISHNLTVPPELLIVKNRTDAHDWFIYSEPTGNAKELGFLTGKANTSSRWQETDPTSTVFYVSQNTNVNANGSRFIAYLFATLAGISKVGSYSGTGSNVDVDCGFTAGARFVMIKRTDATGDWYVFDSDNGIVSGNDPYWRPNVEGPEVTGNDYIDPLNAGFTVTSSAPADLNASGGTYIFLAIA